MQSIDRANLRSESASLLHCPRCPDFEGETVSISWRWVVLLPFVWGAWNHWQGRPVHHAPAVLVAQDPVQVDLSDPPARLSKNGYQITPLESFALEARV